MTVAQRVCSLIKSHVHCAQEAFASAKEEPGGTECHPAGFLEMRVDQ